MKHLFRASGALVVVLSLTSASAPATDDIYVSRDANGRPVYSDREPRGPHVRVHIESRPAPAKSVVSSSADQRETWQQAAQDRENRARRAEAERLAAAEEAAKRCAQARRQQAIYGVDGRKCDYDENGNRKCLSSAEIDAKRAEAKQLMAENCLGGTRE